ncbi:MAG: hypothetical protein ACE5R4_14795 [Armatimonadota bacterium]
MRANRLCLLMLIVMLAAGTLLSSTQATAGLFDGLFGAGIKIVGVGLVLDRWGDDIDDFINRILGQKRARIEGKTKVVEIIRVGSPDAAVGAAQVMGPAHRVRLVQAVAEVELDYRALRGRGLLPVSTKKQITRSITMVGGTGVSANIKFPL